MFWLKVLTQLREDRIVGECTVKNIQQKKAKFPFYFPLKFMEVSVHD